QLADMVLTRRQQVDRVDIGAEPQLAFHERFVYALEFAAHAVVGWDIEELRLVTVRGRKPIDATPQRGAELHQLAVDRSVGRIRARPAGLRVDAGKHVLVDEGLGPEKLDVVVGLLQQPEVAVARRVNERVDGLALIWQIDKDRRPYLVPVPRIIVVILEMAD